jgi:hypothetical protein
MAIQHATNCRSASLSHEGSTYVAPDAKIHCLRDYIVLEPVGIDYGSVIEVKDSCKPTRGIVKAVGPGVYPKRYDHPDKHRRTRMWDSKVFQPCEVKVGDLVELGGMDIGGYSFQTFMWGDKLHVICREADVSGVVTDDLPEIDNHADLTAAA